MKLWNHSVIYAMNLTFDAMINSLGFTSFDTERPYTTIPHQVAISLAKKDSGSRYIVNLK